MFTALLQRKREQLCDSSGSDSAEVTILSSDVLISVTAMATESGVTALSAGP